MQKRWTSPRLHKALQASPAVALLGVRQIGKTTLARQIEQEMDAIYLDLEDPADALKLADPRTFFDANQNKLIILDEIQRKPDLFKVLRGTIDRNRAHGHKVGQFLLLGSATGDLLQQSSESLAGRIRYMNMSGFNVLEAESVQKLWLHGGFPDSYLSTNNDMAMEWLEDLITTYLERDIPMLGVRVAATRLRRLWTMLAHLQGEAVIHATLAKNLGVSAPTIATYLDLLCDLLLVRRLHPWHTNAKKRLVKNPRYYIRDSGIVHRLLGIGNYNALLSNPVLGKSWEGFVMENIHSVLPRLAETYYYRTKAGAEIDLVIKMPSSEVWAVEVKHGSAPTLDGKHYAQTCADIGATHKYIIYGGDDEFPIASDIHFISLPLFMKKLTAQSDE